MIARWMLAASLLSVLAAIAAMGGERVLRSMHRPLRGVWLVALTVSVCWPPLAALLLTRDAEPVARATMGAPVVVGSTVAETAITPVAWMVKWMLAHLDTLLLVLWATLSAVMLVQALRALATLYRIRRTATRVLIDDAPVLVTEALGPAALGLVRPQVVMPAWLLSLDDSLRALVVRHEQEHCRARDPWIVWGAVLATSLMPWNAGVWFIARRLRLAMEVDCDARTLRASTDRQRYAQLLLLIAQRGHSARFAPMLAHSRSQLARRIAAMSTPPAPRPRLQRTLATLVTGAAIVAACSRPVVSNLAGPAPVAPATTAITAEQPTATTGSYFDFQVERPARPVDGMRGPRYPESLRAAGVEGRVLAQYVVNPSGRVDTSTIKIVKSDHAEFSAAVRATLAEMRYEPAMVGDRAVRQLVQSPFEFSLASPAGAVAVAPAAVAAARAPGAPAPARAAAAAPAPARAAAVAAMSPPSVVAPAAPAAPASPLADRQASLPADFKSPAYPTALRASRTEGSVVVQIVINADGSADMNSLKVLRSSHELFTQAVRETLAQTRFTPAVVNGRAVRQLLQLPFEFSATKDDAR
jgi:TonB family protein